MTQVSFPFDSGPGANITEDQWRKMARHWLDSGVLRGEDLNLETFADATGMQVKVRTGKAWVRGHYYESDATETLAIAAAHATLARTDRVVVRADFTANTVVLAVVTGVAGGGTPALTQSTAMWEVPLALVAVPAADASIDAAQVTDDRAYAVPRNGAGGTLGYAQVVAGQAGIGAAATDLTGLAVTVTVAAGRRLSISAHARVAQNTATGVNELSIQEGATGLGRGSITLPVGTATHGPAAIVTPAAGAHTYKLTLRTTAGSTDLVAGADQPAFLLVEDIGAV